MQKYGFLIARLHVASPRGMEVTWRRRVRVLYILYIYIYIYDMYRSPVYREKNY